MLELRCVYLSNQCDDFMKSYISTPRGHTSARGAFTLESESRLPVGPKRRNVGHVGVEMATSVDIRLQVAHLDAALMAPGRPTASPYSY